MRVVDGLFVAGFRVAFPVYFVLLWWSCPVPEGCRENSRVVCGGHRWVCWEGREEDKKLDKFWSDTYLRLFSVDSYARFWLGYQHLPQPG